MQFDLVSPERKLASMDVSEVEIPGAEGDFFATGAGCCKGCELAHGFGCCVFFSSDDVLMLVGRTNAKGNKKRLLLDFILNKPKRLG